MDEEKIRQAVRDRYGAIARAQSQGCCDPQAGSSCCGSPQASGLGNASLALGYALDDIQAVPQGANLGLGCGNPQAIAGLTSGEVVLDLGSGGGFDCFLAAKKVGPSGQVIGVDMTYDMLNLARTNAVRGGYGNVEFRLGEIEHLPVADQTVDVVLSNCVINLSPNKPQVYREAYRVLKKGGRLAVSDMVASQPIPDPMKADLGRLSQCIAGAVPVDEVRKYLTEAGFSQIKIQPKEESRSFVKDWVPGSHMEDLILSATIEAVKE